MCFDTSIIHAHKLEDNEKRERDKDKERKRSRRLTLERAWLARELHLLTNLIDDFSSRSVSVLSSTFDGFTAPSGRR